MKTQKTLLAILVEELPKRGGWPAGAIYAVQDLHGYVYYRHTSGPMKTFITAVATNCNTATVTREQYEQAIASACPTIGPTCAGCPDCPGASSTGLTSGDITNAAVSAAPKNTLPVLMMIDMYESGVDLRMSDAAAIAEHLIAQGYRRQDV